MSATPDEPQTDDPMWRPTVGISLFYRAGACGCTVTERVPPSNKTAMGYRDLRCLEHDEPMIPYET